MKILKGISLFLIYPLLMLGVGFYTGVKASHFFYPGEQNFGEQNPGEMDLNSTDDTSMEQQLLEPMQMTDDFLDYDMASGTDDVQEVAVTATTLCVDTNYVLEEADVLNDTIVETSRRLPDKYIGMNREQFLQAMQTYENSPPLSEQERGFVSLEVISFSRDRVVVRKNYEYVQPSSSFYLAVYNNEIIVYLEDKETVYIETHIPLDSLPEEMQGQIIDMLWIEDEEKLYSFLENYSS